MKQAFALIALIVVALLLAYRLLGYETTYQIAYGAITIMGLLIAGTFVWLWVMRATPLALGMVFSWSGGALVMAWWWVHHLLGRPEVMHESPVLFVFLAFYITGAILHFVVIQGTLHLPRRIYAALAGLAVVLPSVLLVLR